MFDFLRGTTPTGILCMILASAGAFLFVSLSGAWPGRMTLNCNQGFDNGWWGTILGSQTFLSEFGSCSNINGSQTCRLSTSQLSAGSSVQSGGISKDAARAIQGILTLDAVIGCVVAMYLNNYLGRRLSLTVTGVVSIIGVLIEITSSIGGNGRFGQFVAGKTIASIAMGLAVNIVPVYLSETSTGAARGFAVSMYQNVQILGVILASGVVYASSRSSTSSAYLIPMSLQLIAPTIMIAASPALPESPRWLVWKGYVQPPGTETTYAHICLVDGMKKLD